MSRLEIGGAKWPLSFCRSPGHIDLEFFMATNTFARIEKILQETEVLTPEKKDELLGLLATLRSETAAMDPAHAQAARDIALQAQDLAEHALNPDRDREAMRHGLGRLAASVTGFEQTHPRLVQIVNTLCTALSNMGI